MKYMIIDLRISLRLFFWPVMEVDYPTPCRAIWSRIDILAVEVRKEYICILRICLNELRRNIRLQNESHTYDLRSLEADPRIGSEPVRTAGRTGNRVEVRRNPSSHYSVYKTFRCWTETRAGSPDGGIFQHYA